MRKLLTIPLALIVAASVFAPGVFAAVQGQPRAPRQNLPSDQPRRHVEVVTIAGHPYAIHFSGAVDGAMTRMPISYGPHKQGWQPNVLARIENVGDTDVVNPWLTVNGIGDWRTVERIAQEATRGCTTDADKARAVWEWTRRHRFHACTWDGEVDDAVKAYNIYGYTLCGDEGPVLADVWKAAGLKTRRGYPIGHCVSEAFHDGEFHLLDGDEHVICLARDNQTIASEAEVVRDHDLMKRTHTYGIGQGDSRQIDEFSASLYGYEGARSGENGGQSKHKLLFTLRPGESLEWRWDHVGKEYSNGLPAVPGRPSSDGTGTLSEWGAQAYDNLRNGKWVYRPPLDKTVWQKGALAVENAAGTLPSGPSPPGRGESRSDGVRFRDPAKPMVITWRVASPYVLVGGSVRCQYALGADTDLFRLSVSPDGKAWQKLAEGGNAGPNSQSLPLDPLLSPRGKPMYQYFIKLEMQGSKCVLSSIVFDNDIQMALLAMPELVTGDNKLLYTDDTPGSRQVKLTQEWIERSEWHPPSPPALAYPADQSSVEGTQFAFKWTPAVSPDKDARIVDYHLQVCDRSDLRWVLSPNFDKLLSHTASRGKCEWTVPYVGLLNPDTTYYWRVRAQDSHGVWGPWSAPRRFQCRAPGVPLNLGVTADPSTGTATLTWQANPGGRQAVSYKVYGSDEQGFSASDTEYPVFMGRGFCETMADYNARTDKDPGCGNVSTPANNCGQANQTTMRLSGALKAFYRVVALDDQGNASGPSDYVALPRPFVYTLPPLLTKGTYRYAPQAVRSLGDLTCLSAYYPAFWNREKLTWTLEKAPDWLKIADGVLSGIPPAPGRYDVVLKVTNNKQQQAQQSFTITAQ